MEGRRLIESLIGVAGIWLLARQIPDYATTLVLLLAGELHKSALGPDLFLVQSIHFAASIVAGMILLLARKALGRWLHPDASEVLLPAQPLFAAGIAILGVHFLISGLISLSQYLEWHQAGTDQPHLKWSGISSVVLGAMLFVANPWVSRLWRNQFRGTGAPPNKSLERSRDR